MRTKVEELFCKNTMQCIAVAKTMLFMYFYVYMGQVPEIKLMMMMI